MDCISKTLKYSTPYCCILPNFIVTKFNKIVILEWNMDKIKGYHYHCMLPEWKNSHSESGKSKDVIHYRVGYIMPEPWVHGIEDTKNKMEESI